MSAELQGNAEVVAIDVPDPRGWDWPARATSTGMAMLGVIAAPATPVRQRGSRCATR